MVFLCPWVFIRDIGQLGSFLGLALLYSSGVFYSAEKAEKTAPQIWQILQWNPLLQIIVHFEADYFMGRARPAGL